RSTRDNKWRSRRHKQIAIDAARSADRAGNRCPDGLAFVRSPGQTHAGLHFKTGVIVVLELGSNSEFDTLRNHGDLVLDKSAEELQIPVRGNKSDGGCVVDPVGHQPIAPAPNKYLSVAPGETMLKVNVIGVELLCESGRFAPGAVPVHLDRDF